MMKTKLQLNSCGLDSDSLDDWLENDLRQFGILPADETMATKHIKMEKINDWERQSCDDESDDKTVVDDHGPSTTCPPKTPTQLPTQLPPFLKVLALLTTLQQQGVMIPPLPPLVQQLPSPTLSDSINPLQTTMTPPKETTQPIISNNPTKKRQRSVNSAPGTTLDGLDPLALKRLKNTDAARRSRLRKMMKMEGLESRVTELEKHNEQLRLKVTRAEAERDIAQDKESRQREKVAALEAKLAETHRSLLQVDDKDYNGSD